MRKDYALTPEQKNDARRALSLIAHTGRTLTQICERYLDLNPHIKPVEPVPLHKAISDFLADCSDRGLRGGSLMFYEVHLWKFEQAFPRAQVADFTKEKLQTYFAKDPGKAGGKEARWRAVRALFNWLSKQDPCPLQSNPAAGVTVRRPPRETEVEFFSVPQVRKILKNAQPPHRHALALGFFAGLRPLEICGGYGKQGLQWENIQRQEKCIRVPSGVAKGRATKNNARLLEDLPPNLWSWLADGPESGPVYPYAHRALTDHGKLAGGFKRWLYDGCRHSFATYHVALYRDPGKTSLLLGHKGSTAMLRDHYMGLATIEQAKIYFDLVPA